MRGLHYPSPILNVAGFSNRLIWDDTLHVAFRGFAADYTASAIIDLFGRAGSTRASELLHSWSKMNQLEISLDDFSFSDDSYPSLNAKAWDIKLVCLWLAFRQHSDIAANSLPILGKLRQKLLPCMRDLSAQPRIPNTLMSSP